MREEKKSYPVNRLIHLSVITAFSIALILMIANIRKICSAFCFNEDNVRIPLQTFHKIYIHYPPDEALQNGITMFLSLVIIYLLFDFIFFTGLKGWKKALSVILSVVFILGGTEITMSYYSRMYPILHRPHPTLLWENTPNYCGVSHGFNEEVFINCHGFRSQDIPEKKPPGQTRIMLLGDSSAYGFRVRNNETFGSVLLKKLRSTYPDKDIKLLNTAVAGWTTYQAATFMKEKGWQFSPDIIIIAFNNDCWGEQKEDVERVPPAHLIPVLRILYRSNIYMGIKRVVLNDRLKKDPRPAFQPRFGKAKSRVSIEDFRKNLNYIIEGASGRNAKVMILTMPLQVAGYRKLAYRDVMRDTAEKYNLPCVSFDRDFAEYPFEEVFIDMMHPTAKGHKIIGENIYGMIAQQKWLDK